MESRDSLLRVIDEHGDHAGHHLKQAWREDGSQESQNFMKNGVLVTMRSEDIVRKAKALADTYADKWKAKVAESFDDWDTVLHAENKEARTMIQANKMRMKDLTRRLTELKKRREKVRQLHRQRNERKWEPVVETCDVTVTMNDKTDEETTKKSKDAEKNESEDEVSDLDEIDPDTLPMYKMTDERLQLLKTWDTNNWSLDNEGKEINLESVS